MRFPLRISKLSSFGDYLAKLPSFIRVISFDVFDTLLLRTIDQQRVLSLSGHYLSNHLALNHNIHRSASALIADRLAYSNLRRSTSELGEHHWTLSQWLRDLSVRLDLSTDALLAIGRDAELDAQYLGLKPASAAVQALEHAKAGDRLVIAISDMWLDQEWLDLLLRRFGLEFDKVFTSGSMMASKKGGDLFRHVAHILGHHGQHCLHGGDNLFHDAVRPILNGWHSVWLPKPHPIANIWIPKPFWKGALKRLAADEIIDLLKVPSSGQTNPFHVIGCEYLAPLLVLFALMQWRLFRRFAIDTVFYVARDAWSMKLVYDQIEDLLYHSPPRHYLRLSRKAIALLHPDQLLIMALPLPGKTGRKNFREWLSNFTIPEELKIRLLMEVGLKFESSFSKTNRALFAQACLKHKNLLASLILQQSNQLRAYLKQEAPDSRLERIGLVDSGWAGTTQDTFRGVLRDNELLLGIYLGVSSQGSRPGPNNIKYGLLRDDFSRRPFANPLEATAGVIRLWDTLLREPAGTVTHLFTEPDSVITAARGPFPSLTNFELSAVNELKSGLIQGTRARRDAITKLVAFNELYIDQDIEFAAMKISRSLTTHPVRDLAQAILQLGFDEGNAAGQWRSFGIQGIRYGTAWYPGLFSVARLIGLTYLYYLIIYFALKLKYYKFRI